MLKINFIILGPGHCITKLDWRNLLEILEKALKTLIRATLSFKGNHDKIVGGMVAARAKALSDHQHLRFGNIGDYHT